MQINAANRVGGDSLGESAAPNRANSLQRSSSSQKKKIRKNTFERFYNILENLREFVKGYYHLGSLITTISKCLYTDHQKKVPDGFIFSRKPWY